MLYKILRPITRRILQGYYQKIYVDGTENIPAGQPVILAVNHPSGFTEPCVLATHLDRELYFLMRGDVINDRIKWFFEATNQVPIYRFRDGFSSMRQNEKQFSLCFDVLQDNGCIIIFAEGTTQHIKQTRPIQKGAARIATGALKNRDLEDVWIVPVGVNFEHSPRARSSVSVRISPAVSTREITARHPEDPRKALVEISDQIYTRLKSQMIHVEDPERMATADILLDMRSHEIQKRRWPVAEYKDTRYFVQMKKMADAINDLDAEKWVEMEADLTEYHQKRSEYKISDQALTLPTFSYPFLIGMAPFSLLGGLFFYPVKKLVYFIQKRLNRSAEYVSGFRLAGFLLFIPIFLILWIWISWCWLGIWALFLIVLLPLLSHVSVLWVDQWRLWRIKSRWQQISRDRQDELIQLRSRLMKYFE